jgi:hypothetical protein
MTHEQGCPAAPSHFVTQPSIFASHVRVYPADASGRILRGPFNCECRRRGRGTAIMSVRLTAAEKAICAAMNVGEERYLAQKIANAARARGSMAAGANGLTEGERAIRRNMNVGERGYIARKARNAAHDRERIAAAYLSKSERAILSNMTTPASAYLGAKFQRAVCAAARGAGGRHAIDSAMGMPEAQALADHPPDELLEEARSLLAEIEGQAAAPESFKKICLAGALIHFALNQITPAWAALHPEESGAAPDANYAMPAATLAASAKSIVAACSANPRGGETPRKLATALSFIHAAVRDRNAAGALARR